MICVRVDTGIWNRVVVVSSVYAIELEVVIIFAIIIPDNAIVSLASVVWNAIGVWMDTMDFLKMDVEVKFDFVFR